MEWAMQEFPSLRAMSDAIVPLMDRNSHQIAKHKHKHKHEHKSDTALAGLGGLAGISMLLFQMLNP